MGYSNKPYNSKKTPAEAGVSQQGGGGYFYRATHQGSEPHPYHPNGMLAIFFFLSPGNQGASAPGNFIDGCALRSCRWLLIT